MNAVSKGIPSVNRTAPPGAKGAGKRDRVMPGAVTLLVRWVTTLKVRSCLSKLSGPAETPKDGKIRKLFCLVPNYPFRKGDFPPRGKARTGWSCGCSWARLGSQEGGKGRGRSLRASLLPPIPSALPVTDPGHSRPLVLLPRIHQGRKVQKQQNPWGV